MKRAIRLKVVIHAVKRIQKLEADGLDLSGPIVPEQVIHLV